MSYNHSGFEVLNCTFTNSIVGNVGGAIYYSAVTTSTGASLLVEDCLFRGNQASVGGAIFADDPIALTIRRSVFVDNFATNYGSAVCTTDQADSSLDYGYTVAIEGCTFKDNVADTVGTVVFNAAQAASVSDSAFIHNYATKGGGLVLTATSATWHSLETRRSTAEAACTCTPALLSLRAL